MVFRAYCQTFVLWIGGRTSRDRPACENAIYLKSQVVVLTPRSVMLHNKLVGTPLATRAGLWRLLEVSFGLVW